MIDEIKAVVTAHFGILPIEMVSQRRSRFVARPRQIAMTLSVELTPLSYPAIGRLFDRDHSTVMHAVKTVNRLCREDAAFAATVEVIRAKINEQQAAAA